MINRLKHRQVVMSHQNNTMAMNKVEYGSPQFLMEESLILSIILILRNMDKMERLSCYPSEPSEESPFCRLQLNTQIVTTQVVI